jgi:hypothetical protein
VTLGQKRRGKQMVSAMRDENTMKPFRYYEVLLGTFSLVGKFRVKVTDGWNKLNE